MNKDQKKDYPYQLKHYLNAINYKKNDLMDSEDMFWEKKYPHYIVNKLLSSFTDSILFVNEMNKMHHLDNKLQFHFLLHSLEPRKRFSKFVRADDYEEMTHIKRYYGYSNKKAKQALDLLSDDEKEYIKSKLYSGGVKG